MLALSLPLFTAVVGKYCACFGNQSHPERGRIREHGNELEAWAAADGREKIRERVMMGRREKPAKSCVENRQIEWKIGKSRISWKMAEVIEDKAPLWLFLVTTVDDLNIFCWRFVD